MVNIPSRMYPLEREYNRALNSIFQGAQQKTINNQNDFVALSTNLPHNLPQEGCDLPERMAMVLKLDANNQPFFANLITFGNKKAVIMGTTLHRGVTSLVQRDYDLKSKSPLKTDSHGKYESTGNDVKEAYSDKEFENKEEEFNEKQIEFLKSIKEWVKSEGFTLNQDAERCETMAIFRDLKINRFNETYSDRVLVCEVFQFIKQKYAINQ